MEKELIKSKKTGPAYKPKRVEVTTSLKFISRKIHYHAHKMGNGACTVAGCGCPQYMDNGGTCCNLNSAGGTCNHFPGDHA